MQLKLALICLVVAACGVACGPSRRQAAALEAPPARIVRFGGASNLLRHCSEPAVSISSLRLSIQGLNLTVENGWDRWHLRDIKIPGGAAWIYKPESADNDQKTFYLNGFQVASFKELVGIFSHPESRTPKQKAFFIVLRSTGVTEMTLYEGDRDCFALATTRGVDADSREIILEFNAVSKKYVMLDVRSEYYSDTHIEVIEP